jgi:Sec-independent protein translocase protein TatA
MNFFGIGGTELLVIFAIMLVVAGPKRMIRWAYVLGLYVGKARDMWSQAVTVLQKELDEAGAGIKLPTQPPTRQNLSRIVSDVVKPYTQELEKEWQETQSAVRDINQPVSSAAKPSVTKTAPPKTPATNNGADTFGAWGKATDDAGFGAWSNGEGKEN